jgi:ABC-type transport system involved in cytochrome bd biosynthesis fused ATPase/permease subunit
MNSQQNALEFRKVYFNYKSECISTLTGINLTVPKGENRNKLKYIFFL